MKISNRVQDTDAVVVGAGPNGLAAAITLARAGCSVAVIEAAATVGGGVRTAELTRPGFRHDVCSAIHPLAVGSPFFRALPLAAHGVEFVARPSPLAHPLNDGRVVMLERSLLATAEALERDADAWLTLLRPLVEDWDALAPTLLGPPHLPRHPWLVARFGLRGFRSASGLARGHLATGPARALFTGLAAHGMLPLERVPSAAFGLVLAALAHRWGWRLVRGGSGRLSEALASYLRSRGGRIVTGQRVGSLHDLPPARWIFLDVTPRQLLTIAGSRLPVAYRRRLERYRYGPGVFKVDWALAEPIPWRQPACGRAGTLHLGGALEDIAAAEAAVARGRLPRQPFVLLSQPSLFDPTRAPSGRHTAWGYCPVPHGEPTAMTSIIETIVERYAPGFGQRILARHTMSPAELEGVQRQLRWRRHQRRASGLAAALHSPGGVPGALRHTGAWPLPLLGLDSSRRRCAWALRLLGGAGGPRRSWSRWHYP